jgi:hypothetical protein
MKPSLKSAPFAVLIALLVSAASLSAQIAIRDGTVLPARLNSTLSSKNSKPGRIITARIMQDVPLPRGAKIPQGATVIGRITTVTPASSGNGASVSLRFDTLKIAHQQIPITTNLRAIASFVEVEEAQIPLNGADRGTPENAYTTVQIGGEAVYRGGGPVEGRFGKVGRPVDSGVLVHLNANPDGGCRGDIGENPSPQALWLFSSNACGAYGLRHVIVANAGRSDAAGEIILRASKGDVNIRSGAGLLLRVDASGSPDALGNVD